MSELLNTTYLKVSLRTRSIKSTSKAVNAKKQLFAWIMNSLCFKNMNELPNFSYGIAAKLKI